MAFTKMVWSAARPWPKVLTVWLQQSLRRLHRFGPLLMHSAIYRGVVRHRRFTPTLHQFRYQVFMMYLDLDELDKVFGLTSLWSKKPWRPVRFERSDFLGDPTMLLKQSVQQRVLEETGRRHSGPIRMLANLRYFGFNINPIACYYCFNEREQLQNIVVEVTNTPWDERQSYVLDCDPEKPFQRINFEKKMHVSPFNPMEMHYLWTSNQPATMLSLNLETQQEGQTHVDATLTLKRSEITAGSLRLILLQHPWMTAKVAAAIYWQAVKLWFKRTPFYHHPKTQSKI
jgi:DUF1365 family protein